MSRAPRSLRIGLCLALSSVFFHSVQTRADFFFDDFNDNFIDPAVWTAYVYGSGPQIDETNQQLEMWMPSSSSGGDFGVKLASNFLLHGDFDVQVDFRLLTWPYGNGVRMALGTNVVGLLPHPGVERISFGYDDYPSYPREVYLTDFLDGVAGITETDDTAGKLRLVRTGSYQTGYYYSGGGWALIHTGPAPTEDVAIKVAAFSAYQFMHWDVLGAFDNFTVNSGEIIWPCSPAVNTTWGSIKALYR